ncbi:MAG: methyltransferase domain-containing protein [Chitinophagaceae bacterium]|nr:methyltransferase domain-containing protein [Chitinophagaceae bacterium]
MNNNIPDNWYETFFEGINCEMWEKADTSEWTSTEVAFINDVLHLPADSKILDMPCGTGRHSVMLARQGFQVTAVDISAEFINNLRKTVEAEHLTICVAQADILLVQLNEMFDGAFCFGNSFGYFTYDNMQKFIQKVAGALKPGAKWIIHSGLIAESFLAKFSKEEIYELPGLTMQVNNEYDEWNSCLLTTLTYTKNGKEEVHSFKHHVYSIAEVIRWLKRAGLKTTALYNSTNKEVYKLDDMKVYLVAEKM